MPGTLFALLLATAPLRAQGTVTLPQALQLAAEHSPQNEVARWSRAAARARVHQVRSYFLPSIQAEGALLWWDEPLEAQFVEGDPCAELDEYMQEFCGDLIGDFAEPIVLREQQTTTLSVKATQPLTSLYGISQGHRARRALERAAAAEQEQTAAEVALSVVDAFYGALELEHQVDLAEKGLETLKSYEDQARALYDAGVIGQQELLQIQVARSNAHVDLLRARTGRELLRRQLAVVVGTGETALLPEDLHPGSAGDWSPPPLDLPESELANQVTDRPEVEALDHRVEAARAGLNAARAERVPQVAALGVWERNWGMGELYDDRSWYLGLGLSWDVWSWGHDWYAAKAAQAEWEQARAGQQALREGMALEARAALEQARVAREAFEASHLTVEQATRNLEIQQARFDNQTLTASELLEAETLYQQARTDRIAARFELLRAVAALQRALGQEIHPWEGVGR